MVLTELQKKLGIKENKKIIFINEPKEFRDELGVLPDGAEVKKQLRGSFDVILLFAVMRAEVEKITDKLVNSLKKDA